MAVGFFLGMSSAYAFYRQHFPPLSSRRAGEPLVAGFEGAAEGGLGLGFGAGGQAQRASYLDLEAAAPDPPA